MIDRRSFVTACGATFLAGLDPFRQEALARSDSLYVSACQKSDGAFAVALFTEDGTILHLEDCPARAHDATVCPVSGRIVVFARRPGTFALVMDPSRRQTPFTIVSAAGRHFYGHGVFSPDGRLLYATENDFDAARGVVGIYDASDGFRRLGEFETHGIGPHEILLTPDGRTLAIANGGIETHPDFGRAKLNLDSMEPSIVFLDRRSGTLVERHACEPRWRQLSLRHMTFDRSGDLWFGCQYEGAQSDLPPLIGKVGRETGLRLLDMPAEHLQAMQNYVGSVASSNDGDHVAISAPHGNLIVIVDTAGRVVRTAALADGCGLAPRDGGFLATSGEGQIVALDTTDRAVTTKVRWDNHILRAN